MKIIPNIAVIIPSNHGYIELLKIVEAVCCQTIKPDEIIIVDSSQEWDACPISISLKCEELGVNLIYVHRTHAFPGQARNIGLDMAHADMLAFIDVQTIPRPQWLEFSLDVISRNNIAGVYGMTSFSAVTMFEKIVRDAFYGISPKKTLPGSVFRRNVFLKTGQFIDWVRAGEDTDWMLRLDLLNIPVIYPSTSNINYDGLVGLNLKKLLKKWYRNYKASHDLPHLYPQKLFLWFFLYPTIIFIAFNWNYLIANWQMDSPLYIGHITKIVSILPVFAYVFTRGILMPYRRGVPALSLFPIRFIVIASICFMADAVKAFAFTSSGCKRRFNKEDLG